MVTAKVQGKRTVSDVVEEFGVKASARLRPFFEEKGVAYPPEEIALLAVKDEGRMELWARYDNRWRMIKTYAIQAASGRLGPKLREGDRQVPEGMYRIEFLNPNSAYHLSMKLNYPNGYDRARAREEGRSHPGSDIFIHGNSVSVGCLAMGDEVIEELFILAERTGKDNVRVIIAPRDPRNAQLSPPTVSPRWVSQLYRNIEREFLQITGT